METCNGENGRRVGDDAYRLYPEYRGEVDMVGGGGGSVKPYGSFSYESLGVESHVEWVGRSLGIEGS